MSRRVGGRKHGRLSGQVRSGVDRHCGWDDSTHAGVRRPIHINCQVLRFFKLLIFRLYVLPSYYTYAPPFLYTYAPLLLLLYRYTYNIAYTTSLVHRSILRISLCPPPFVYRPSALSSGLRTATRSITRKINLEL